MGQIRDEKEPLLTLNYTLVPFPQFNTSLKGSRILDFGLGNLGNPDD